MNIPKRCEFLRAMDLIARAAVTQEEYELVEDTSGGLIDRTADDDDLALFVEDDDDFADLLDEFLIVMRSLRENGGITCDSVNSGAPRIGSDRRWRGDLCRGVGAGIAAILTYFFGGADAWLLSFLGVVIIDYISGVTAAALKHELSSKRGMAGILKKVLLFCVVGVAHLVDIATGAGGVLRALTIGFLLANEAISVLENCGRCGIPLPKKLLAVLEQLRDDNEK